MVSALLPSGPGWDASPKDIGRFEVRVPELTIRNVSRTLYRPVGVAELRLIAQANWRAFPPRLPGQPIFYPELEHAYAVQIAGDWNVTDEASGFVTEFEVTDECASKYSVEVVGGSQHRELWVPAEELEAFNAAIVGQIRVRESFYGDRYAGERPPLPFPNW